MNMLVGRKCVLWILLPLAASAWSPVSPTVLVRANDRPVGTIDGRQSYMNMSPVIGQLDAEATSGRTRSEKRAFLTSLDHQGVLNEANSKSTESLSRLVDNKVDQDINTFLKQSSATTSTSVSIENPGQWESMLPVAPGTWNVIYAPHMTTMAKVFGGGEFRVQYIMNEDGTMVSHARLGGFPWLFGLDGLYLSVSGTYGSVSDSVCRVDFDEAWIKTIPSGGNGGAVDEPYMTIADVPNTTFKSLVTAIGSAFFVKDVSVFPVSFLDDDLIVFDFELLGTRICAQKILPALTN